MRVANILELWMTNLLTVLKRVAIHYIPHRIPFIYSHSIVAGGLLEIS